METVVVVVDTTEFFNDYELRGRGWAELLELAERSLIRLVVPRPVVRETARHYRREASRLDQQVISVLADVLKQLDRVASVPELNIRDLRRDLKVRRAGYESELEALLRSRGVRIAPTPEMSTQTLLDWAIDERQPFKQTGEGFRDALVWGTVLEVAHGLDPEDLVLLITGNTSDFCGVDGKLGLALQKDVDEIRDGPAVVVQRSIADGVRFLINDTPTIKSAREALKDLSEDDLPGTANAEELLTGLIWDICDGFTGQPVHEAAGGQFQLELPTGRLVRFSANVPPNLWGTSVYEVEPFIDTLTWDAYDRYSDRVLGTAVLRVEITIDGTVPTAEIDSVVAGWSPRDIDYSYEDDEDSSAVPEDRVWLAFALLAELRVNASIQLMANNVESVELDSITVVDS